MTAKLNVQHDYITLRATFGAERLNLTISRRGETASGTYGDLRGALEAFSAYMDRKEGLTVGGKMDVVRILAENAKSADHFVESLRAACEEAKA